LVAIAVPINSASVSSFSCCYRLLADRRSWRILILAAAVFYKGPNEDNDVPAGLFDAHDLIKARIGKG
jgi:hypothetical protein